MELHTIGIDLGKTIFHLVGLELRGSGESADHKFRLARHSRVILNYDPRVWIGVW